MTTSLQLSGIEKLVPLEIWSESQGTRVSGASKDIDDSLRAGGSLQHWAWEGRLVVPVCRR